MSVRIKLQYRNGDWDSKYGEAAFRGEGHLVLFDEGHAFMHELDLIEEVKFEHATIMPARQAFEEMGMDQETFEQPYGHVGVLMR